MKRTGKAAFDPKVFLAKVGNGRTLADYKKNQKVFSQGDPADAIFYIQSGKVKLTVVSKQGKEAVVAILGADDFFGEGCPGLEHQQPISLRVRKTRGTLSIFLTRELRLRRKRRHCWIPLCRSCVDVAGALDETAKKP